MAGAKNKKIELLSSPDVDNEYFGVFVLHVLMLNSVATIFPHPTEDKIHFRIQTYKKSKSTALDALKKGLRDLSGVCTHIIETFNTEVDHYKSTHEVNEENQ